MLLIDFNVIYLCNTLINCVNMGINRIKVVLAENDKKNKWLAKALGKSESTISNWCTNESQPSLETLQEVANVLDVDVRELIHSTKN